MISAGAFLFKYFKWTSFNVITLFLHNQIKRYYFNMTIRWILVAVLSLFITSCSLFSSATDDSNVVGSVNGEPIYYEELMDAYQGSSEETSPALEEEAEDADLLEFLDLYIDYRTKLAVAEESGIIESEEMKAQLEDYQKQTAYPYWLERKVREDLIDELIERQQKEVHASHILISLPEDATPADTLEAYNELIEARNRHLEDGEDFDQLSMEYSTRQQGRSMGGDLGFFTGGMMIKPFEDKAYNTPVDSVSKPFRTEFGMHLLKVKDKREPLPERNISHIFWNTQEGQHAIDESLEEASEVYDMLNAERIEWEEAVQRYSQDPQSAGQGGDIGWVSQNDFNETFTEELLSLEESGSIGEPFYSEYGVHILRLDSIRAYETDEQLREDMYERLRQLPRYRENREAVLSTIRSEHDEQIYRDTRAAIDQFVKEAGTTEISELNWPESLASEPLYAISDAEYTAGDFFEWLENQPGEETYHYSLQEEFFDYAADEQVIPLTEKSFPEFSEITDQYLDGLAVFEVNEDSIWNYARQDTQSIKRIYEENPDDYRYPRRYEYTRFSANSDSLLDEGLAYFEEGIEPDSIDSKIDGLVARTNITSELESEPLEHLQGKQDGEFTERFTWRGRPTVLYMHEVKEPRRMTFEEAFNRVASDYQPIREEEWMQEMRARYNSEAYPERLRNLKSEEE